MRVLRRGQPAPPCMSTRSDRKPVHYFPEDALAGSRTLAGRTWKPRGADALRLHSGRVVALAPGAGSMAGRAPAGVPVDAGACTVLWGAARRPRDHDRDRA